MKLRNSLFLLFLIYFLRASGTTPGNCKQILTKWNNPGLELSQTYQALEKAKIRIYYKFDYTVLATARLVSHMPIENIIKTHSQLSKLKLQVYNDFDFTILTLASAIKGVNSNTVANLFNEIVSEKLYLYNNYDFTLLTYASIVSGLKPRKIAQVYRELQESQISGLYGLHDLSILTISAALDGGNQSSVKKVIDTHSELIKLKLRVYNEFDFAILTLAAVKFGKTANEIAEIHKAISAMKPPVYNVFDYTSLSFLAAAPGESPESVVNLFQALKDKELKVYGLRDISVLAGAVVEVPEIIFGYPTRRVSDDEF